MNASDRQMIGRLTKEGAFFDKYGALYQERRALRYALEQNQPGTRESIGALSAASSTYYAAAGNAQARAKKNPLWYLVAIWCLIRSRYLSDQMKKEAGGLTGLTPAELDIRASICSKWFGSESERRACLNTALLMPHITPESKALILIQLAEMDPNADPLRNYDKILALRNEVSTLTVCRMLRSKARCTIKATGSTKWAGELLEEARQIAEKHNLQDQVQKIESEMARI